MKKQDFQDLDNRGISPQDTINGDTLTLVSYDRKKRRRVSLALYLTGEFPNPQFRRNMGWIQPSLDNDPPHPIILADMLRAQANAQKKAQNIAAASEAYEARLAKKRARREACLARKAKIATP